MWVNGFTIGRIEWMIEFQWISVLSVRWNASELCCGSATYLTSSQGGPMRTDGRDAMYLSACAFQEQGFGWHDQRGVTMADNIFRPKFYFLCLNRSTIRSPGDVTWIRQPALTPAKPIAGIHHDTRPLVLWWPYIVDKYIVSWKSRFRWENSNSFIKMDHPFSQ